MSHVGDGFERTIDDLSCQASMEDVELHLGIEPDGNRVLVRVAGEVDLYSAPQLEDALNSAVHSYECILVLDLAHCTYFDSEGFKVLIRIYLAHHLRQPIVVQNARAGVNRAFRLLHMDRIFYVQTP